MPPFDAPFSPNRLDGPTTLRKAVAESGRDGGRRVPVQGKNSLEGLK